jgi:ribokinase
MLKPGVAVVGSLNADLTLLVDHLPKAGETVLSIAPGNVGFGGKGGNQAAAAAAFGAEVTMIGRVGDDESGRQLRADLAARGIDVSRVLVTPGVRSGTATIAVDASGDNLIIVDPGANSQLRPDDVSDGILGRASAIVVQLEIPLPTVAAAIRAARGLVVLNPAPAVPIQPALLGMVDVLVANMPELGLLTAAERPATLAAIVQLAGRLARQTDVVVTLGADGAVVVSRCGGPVTHVAAPTADVVDATGAGDCFCGSLAVSLAGGLSLADAVRLSVAAATISTSATGARGHLPTRHEAESLAANLASHVIA